MGDQEELFKEVSPEELEKMRATGKEDVDEEYTEGDATESEGDPNTDPTNRYDQNQMFNPSPSEVNTVPNEMSEAFYTSPDNNVGQPKYFRRADWGALMPKWIDSLPTPVSRVVVSFTETEPCKTEEECKITVRRIQQKHLTENGVPDIKHNFLIGGDGNIYEGRGFMRMGPVYKPSPKHIEDLNGVSIDIGLIEKTGEEPSDDMRNGLSWCMAQGVEEGFIERDFFTNYINYGELPSKLMMGVFSNCVAQGIDQKFIEKQYHTYYIMDNEIFHISPPCFDKDGKEIKRD